MSSNLLIGSFASGLWFQLGSPTAVSSLTISGYLVTPNTCSQVNNAIGSCYQPTGTPAYDITPDISSQELSIAGLYFEVGYWNNIAQASMGQGGLALGGNPVQGISEGDTKITYANAASIGAVYADMALQAKRRLDYAVNQYLLNSVGILTPLSVINPNVVYGGPNGWSQAGWGLG